MPMKIESPAAGGTASGAKSKADEAPMKEYLIQRRAAMLARVLGVSIHAAATIEALAFPEVAR